MTTFAGPLDAIPLAGLFVGIFLLVLLSVECGWHLGRYIRRSSEHEMEAPVGGMVAAGLGLLAFMLAFTFNMSATRFDARRQVVVEEANAIGTAYLRAGMLPGRQDEIRDLIRDYLDVRLEMVRTGALAEGIRQSEAMQRALWAEAEAIARSSPDSIVVGLFVQSLNEVIDIHARRLAVGVRSRVPGTIWLVLFSVAGISLGAMGYHIGLSGSNRSFVTIAVAIIFSTVIWLIADLDRPREGTLTVSQQAMMDARQMMSSPLP
jgi:hypothetical protein